MASEVYPISTGGMRRAEFTSKWAFRDRVYIDSDRSIVAVVTQFNFTDVSQTVRCCWFANGDAKEAWFEEWRLSEAE